MSKKMLLLFLFAMIFCSPINLLAYSGQDNDNLFRNGCKKKISIPEPTEDDVAYVVEHVYGILLKNNGSDLTSAVIKLKINPDLNYDKIGHGWRKLLLYINNDENKVDDILWLLSTPVIYKDNAYNIDVIIRWKSLVDRFTPDYMSFLIKAVFSQDIKRGESYDAFVKAFLEGDYKKMINIINSINYKVKASTFKELSEKCSRY